MDFSKIENDLKKKKSLLHYWLILLHYWELLHYREFITLFVQNVIIDLFQDILLVCMAAILKTGIRIPLGILNGFWQDKMTKKKCLLHYLVKFITLSGSITLLVDFITLSGSITLSGVYYIIGAQCYN